MAGVFTTSSGDKKNNYYNTHIHNTLNHNIQWVDHIPSKIKEMR
jgi:hypothetical protein